MCRCCDRGQSRGLVLPAAPALATAQSHQQPPNPIPNFSGSAPGVRTNCVPCAYQDRTKSSSLVFRSIYPMLFLEKLLDAISLYCKLYHMIPCHSSHPLVFMLYTCISQAISGEAIPGYSMLFHAVSGEAIPCYSKMLVPLDVSPYCQECHLK